MSSGSKRVTIASVQILFDTMKWVRLLLGHAATFVNLETFGKGDPFEFRRQSLLREGARLVPIAG